MKLNQILDFLAIRHTPVPSDHYTASSGFAEIVRASLSLGSATMGTGKMITREDHDQLYESFKNYRFADPQ